MSEKVKVSVIVPVYGVKDFVGRCARSLMEQTLQHGVEFIFVDDCSVDGSAVELQIAVEAYPDRKEQVRIVRHEINRGLPAARNTGLALANGEFVLHVDADDYVDPEMLSKLVTKEEFTSADVVWCDFYMGSENHERYMRARDYKSAEELVKRGFLSGDMKYNVWNKLVRRSLFDGIQFPNGHSMGEDMTMIPVCARAKKVAYVPEPLYHYSVANQGAMSHTFGERQISDVLFNAERTIQMLNQEYPGKYDEYIPIFQQGVKLPLLHTGLKEDFQRWRSIFPESDSSIWKNRELPFRTRLLQHMASKGCWRYVSMYHTLMKHYYSKSIS